MVLVGANGCGKSTLLKCMAGLHRNMQGENLLEGRGMESWQPAERAERVAYLPQSMAPGFSFTAREVILLSRYHKIGRDLKEDQARKLKEVASALEVDSLLDRNVDELSGGEWQRVAIARTLMQEARLLLLDEPTAHLDLSHRIALFQYCRELSRSDNGGKGVLCVSHDLDAALEYADRIIVLHQGTVLAEGDPAEIMTEQLLEKVFGAAPVSLQANPLTGRPQLVIRGDGQEVDV